jgi:hypothetical protein
MGLSEILAICRDVVCSNAIEDDWTLEKRLRIVFCITARTVHRSTQVNIACALGISQSRVSQILWEHEFSDLIDPVTERCLMAVRERMMGVRLSSRIMARLKQSGIDFSLSQLLTIQKAIDDETGD